MAELTPQDLLKLFYSDQQKLKLPNDHKLKQIFELYQPSMRVLNFASESDRTIFAESLTTDTYPDPDLKFPKRLSNIAMKVYAENYKGGKIDERITLDELVLFGEMCDINLPLNDVYELDCETFWKRIVEATITDSLKFQALNYDEKINWKQKGIEAKLAKLVEDTPPEDWDSQNFFSLAKNVSPFVKELNLKSLKPLQKFKHRYPDEHIESIPADVCHHGSLAFIENLKNLHTISIRFASPPVGRNFGNEKFEHSYEDIENLSSGIRNLCSLKVLKIQDSPMDNIKMDKLLNDINDCVHLEVLDFSNCKLLDDCLIVIGLYLSRTGSLRTLELQGNLFGGQGMQSLAYGLQKTKSRLDFLGLARNPLKHSGIVELGRGLAVGKNVSKLNLCGCNLENEGSYRVAHIIKLEAKIIELDISCIKFSKNAGDTLLDAIKYNFDLLRLECRECSLTENQEMWIRLYIERNNFYHANPCLAKDTFTKEDEAEITKWLKRVKHPLLIEYKDFVKSLLEKRQQK